MNVISCEMIGLKMSAMFTTFRNARNVSQGFKPLVHLERVIATQTQVLEWRMAIVEDALRG